MNTHSAEQLETVAISIGDETVNYFIATTSAPREFDGFGTLTLAEIPAGKHDKLWRVVLIRSEHLGWQSSRYSSGLHAVERPIGFDASGVRAHLWEHLDKLRTE